MRDNTLYGSALIGSGVLLIAMGLTHPTGAHLLDSGEALERFTFINHLAHGLAIAGLCLAVVGLAGFSRLLGDTRPVVTAALAAFALGVAAGIVAAGIDGFVVPELARRWFDADAATRATLRQLMSFCPLVASALTRIYLALGSTALLLWSFAAWRARLSSGLPWAGVLVAAAAIALTVDGPPMVSVHELLALALGQTVWMAWAGVIMIRVGAQSDAVVAAP